MRAFATKLCRAFHQRSAIGFAGCRIDRQAPARHLVTQGKAGVTAAIHAVIASGLARDHERRPVLSLQLRDKAMGALCVGKSGRGAGGELQRHACRKHAGLFGLLGGQPENACCRRALAASIDRKRDRSISATRRNMTLLPGQRVMQPITQLRPAQAGVSSTPA